MRASSQKISSRIPFPTELLMPVEEEGEEKN